MRISLILVLIVVAACTGTNGNVLAPNQDLSTPQDQSLDDGGADLASMCMPGEAACTNACNSAGCCACAVCQNALGCVPSSAHWSVVANTDGNDLRGVWGNAQSAWAVGASSTVLQWNGSSWSRRTETMFTGNLDVNAVWGAATNDVWIVSEYGGHQAQEWQTIHWDGNQWMNVGGVSGPGPLYAIFGTASNDVWTVGGADPPVALHWTGGPSWQSFQVSTATGGVQSLLGVSGVAANDVLAVTGDPTGVIRWNGTSWAPVGPGGNPPAQLSGGIWAQGDLWVSAVGGAIYNHIGGSWNSSPTGTGNTFRAVYAFGSLNVWAVGDGGTIAHWNGANWTLTTNVTTKNLRALWGASASDLWAVGDGGVILHYAP